MKLRKILAGAMALVMVAGSLLVGPVETKAAPIVEKPELSGYDWWNNTAAAKTEAVALADGDEIVWTIDVNANIGGDGAIYVIESANSTSIEGGGAFIDFSSAGGAWGDATSATTTTVTPDNYTLIQAGNTYTVTLTREGSVIKAVHKNVTTDTVIIEQTATLTDTTLASSTFYMYVQYGEMNYEISKNGTALDSSALRGYAWWNNTLPAKSTPVALVDGGEITWTLDINANIGGDGAIYVLESNNSTSIEGGGAFIDFSSAGGAWGDATSATTTTITTDNFTLFQEGNVYTVTLTREGSVITAVHKNAATGAVILEQTATLADTALESSTFYIYTQYGEIDCTYEVPMKSIEVSGANDKVVAGSTVQLSASVFPANTTDDKTITWSSSDTSKATVDNTGKVTGVTEGKVTITAKVSDTIVDTYEVEVQALQIPMTGIELTTDKTEIKVGTTAQLTTTIAPADTTDDKTVTYTSSDETIATVDANGKVTAVKPGTVTITAKVGTFTDTVEITVPVVPVTSIDLEVNKKDLDKGDIVNIVATVNPADTTEDTTITWTSSDTKVATVDANGTVTAVGGGNATITATIGDVSASIKFKVTAVETVVKKSTLEDMTIGDFLSVVSKGVELKKNHTYTITFDSVSPNAVNNWETPCYAVYTSDEGAYNVGDWYELFLCRADVFGWPGGVFDNNTLSATFPSDYTWATTYPADWAAWLAECKAGTTGKITAKYDGSSVMVTYEIAGAKTVVTMPHTSNEPVYLSLTGQATNISDIVVADEYVKTITGTGDVNMVLPILLVMFGGAVVIVASKKRFA